MKLAVTIINGYPIYAKSFVLPRRLPDLLSITDIIRRVTRGEEEGEVSRAFFQKLEKSTLILGKNALIVLIYGLNFSFKMPFSRVSRNEIGDFSLGAKSLSRVVHDYLSKYPNSKKTPLPNYSPKLLSGTSLHILVEKGISEDEEKLFQLLSKKAAVLTLFGMGLFGTAHR